MKQQAERTLKILLSVWIVYNITAMVVMPNAGSLLGRRWGPVIAPYANAVGLNASWNFFSPDPAHTMYIRYYVEFLNSEKESTQESVMAYFPTEKNKGVMDITRRRDMYAMRFMLIGKNRIEALFGPWVCRQHPGATAIHIEQVIETVAPLDQVISFPDESVAELSKEVQYSATEFECGSSPEEFPL